MALPKRGLVPPPLLVAALVLVAGPGACQSPGPDWPNCAAASVAYYGGWEFLRLSYQPAVANKTLDAVLTLDAQNAADGSRTVCSLRGGGTGDASTRFDSAAGGCETGWSERHVDFTNATHRAPTAAVAFDGATGNMSISQTWTCREQGQLLTFTGSAAGVINMTCAADKEGERTTCSPATLNNVLEPPTFLGPVTAVASPTNPKLAQPTAPVPLPPLSVPTCEFLQLKWQVLSLAFAPPGSAQPKSPSSRWPTSLRAELRNVDDGSRTLCELGADDADAASATRGVLLRSDGQPLDAVPGNEDRLQGCLTGWWHDHYSTDPADAALQEWRWSLPANVTFDTATRLLSISQTYYCERGGHQAVRSSAAAELKLDCKETGNEYYPVVCEPTDAIFSNSSAPVLLPGAQQQLVNTRRSVLA